MGIARKLSGAVKVMLRSVTQRSLTRRVAKQAMGISAAMLTGCVEQTLTVESNPPGALVYMNDQEIGRTPVTRDFKYYGDYDIQLRLEGHQTLRTHKKLIAPIWNWVPFDLLANIQPFTVRDAQRMEFTLEPIDTTKNEPVGLMKRAQDMQGKLESGEFTRPPTTRSAATQPVNMKGSATQP